MEKIPTAEEILRDIIGDLNLEYHELEIQDYHLVKKLEEKIKNLTRLHVKAALEAAAEKAEAWIEYGHGDWMLQMIVEDYGVSKESILTAYPEENIK